MKSQNNYWKISVFNLCHPVSLPSPWLISLQHWLLFFLILFYSFFRRSCKSAWSQLRLSPMFGCICPNKGQNATCDQVFKAVNGNPCIGKCCFVLLLYYPNDVCKYWCTLQKKKRCLYVWWNDLRRLKLSQNYKRIKFVYICNAKHFIFQK